MRFAFTRKMMTKIGSSRILKPLVILGAGFYLLVSLIYGPGRGMSTIPAGYEGLGILRLVTYIVMLIGALCFPKKLKSAVALLVVGIAGRSILEARTSVARSWIESDAGFAPGWFLFVVLMYAVTFVFPFLLLLYAIRLARKTNDQASENNNAEQ